MKRAFYNYELWEDYKSGMYNPPSIDSIDTGITSEERIEKAVECLSNKEICRKYMLKVVNEWKITTEQNLTNLQQNRKAWLGWCACYLYGGCHDIETRMAWGYMTDEARIQANKIAGEVIYQFEQEYKKKCPNYQLTIFD